VEKQETQFNDSEAQEKTLFKCHYRKKIHRLKHKFLVPPKLTLKIKIGKYNPFFSQLGVLTWLQPKNWLICAKNNPDSLIKDKKKIGED
jgi:hypothetical protein